MIHRSMRSTDVNVLIIIIVCVIMLPYLGLVQLMCMIRETYVILKAALHIRLAV